MTVVTMTAALRPAIAAAIAAEFAADAAVSPTAFGSKLDRLAGALAEGIATALVPYIQAAQVVSPAGVVIGAVV